jgi:hypothetical protein
VTARPERPRYRVRVEIPRVSGAHGWSAAATAFEQGLTEQASLLVTDRQIELLTRQRRDYVRVSVTVEAAHIAEAAVVAWAMLQQVAGEDTAGWDLAGASAEIRPAGDARLRTAPAGAADTEFAWPSPRDHPYTTGRLASGQIVGKVRSVPPGGQRGNGGPVAGYLAVPVTAEGDRCRRGPSARRPASARPPAKPPRGRGSPPAAQQARRLAAPVRLSAPPGRERPRQGRSCRLA